MSTYSNQLITTAVPGGTADYGRSWQVKFETRYARVGRKESDHHLPGCRLWVTFSLLLRLTVRDQEILPLVPVYENTTDPRVHPTVLGSSDGAASSGSSSKCHIVKCASWPYTHKLTTHWCQPSFSRCIFYLYYQVAICQFSVFLQNMILSVYMHSVLWCCIWASTMASSL